MLSSLARVGLPGMGAYMYVCNTEEHLVSLNVSTLPMLHSRLVR